MPILTAIFSRIFIGEPVHPFTWAASILAFIGVFIIIRDGLHSSKVAGDMLALLCACCTAAAFTIIRGSGKNVATSLGLGSLVSAIVALLFFDAQLNTLFNTAGFGMPAWVWLALNGLIVIPLSSTLIANGPRYLPSVDVSMFFLLETVLTPLWIWMLFGEVPSRAVLWGGIIIVVTLLVHSIWRLRSGFCVHSPRSGKFTRKTEGGRSGPFQFLAQHFQFQPLLFRSRLFHSCSAMPRRRQRKPLRIPGEQACICELLFKREQLCRQRLNAGGQGFQRVLFLEAELALGGGHGARALRPHAGSRASALPSPFAQQRLRHVVPPYRNNRRHIPSSALPLHASAPMSQCGPRNRGHG